MTPKEQSEYTEKNHCCTDTSSLTRLVEGCQSIMSHSSTLACFDRPSFAPSLSLQLVYGHRHHSGCLFASIAMTGFESGGFHLDSQELWILLSKIQGVVSQQVGKKKLLVERPDGLLKVRIFSMLLTNKDYTVQVRVTGLFKSLC